MATTNTTDSPKKKSPKKLRKTKSTADSPRANGVSKTGSRNVSFESIAELGQPDVWRQWTEHLARRRLALPDWTADAKHSPLKWGCGKFLSAASSDRLKFIQTLTGRGGGGAKKRAAGELERWLDTDVQRDDREAFGLESVAWCHALPELASQVTPELWLRLLDVLLGQAHDACAIDGSVSPLAEQLFAGELRLTLSSVLPEIEACRALWSRGTGSLTHGILEFTDGEGLPNARQLEWLTPLVACWTRCRQLAAARELECLNEAATAQYEFAVQQIIRLRRKDGSQVLSNGDGAPHGLPRLMNAVFGLLTDPDDKALLRFALPRDKRPGSGKLKPPSDLESSYHSEWAETAILRTDWTNKSPVFALTYNDSTVECELHVGSELLWTGEWRTAVEIDGREAERPSGWEETCWYEDEEVAYVELAGNLAGGWKVERQVLLGREDRFLLLADAILGPQASGRIRYESSLPLSTDVNFEPADESSEGMLTGKRPMALVLPLGAPEWRCQPSTTELRSGSTGCLEWRVEQEGFAAYAPLFLDLDRRRIRMPFTWRRLTVAERLEIQPPDVAAGYRVQSGMRQWLIYRSLARRGNRTVLGQNFCNDFYCGRFGVDGECHELIEIE